MREFSYVVSDLSGWSKRAVTPLGGAAGAPERCWTLQSKTSSLCVYVFKAPRAQPRSSVR